MTGGARGTGAIGLAAGAGLLAMAACAPIPLVMCTFHISGNLLLYGAVELDYATNCKLFDAVHDYIDETGRL